jgi:hypothetical protein
MEGGAIGFQTPAKNAAGKDVVTQFEVWGNVDWSGGIFTPGINFGDKVDGMVNRWKIKYNLTVRAESGPTVVPVPQNLQDVGGKVPAVNFEVIQFGGKGEGFVNPSADKEWTLGVVDEGEGVVHNIYVTPSKK